MRSRQRLRPHPLPSAGLPDHSGFSLVEIMVVISIIAVLAAIAIPQISGISDSAQSSVDELSLEKLNRAANSYAQMVQEITNAAGNGADVVALLQIRNTNNPGSPFLPADESFSVSAETNTARAKWTGNFFTNIPAGTAGSGIDLRSH